MTFLHTDVRYRGDIFFRLIDGETERVCMPVSRQAGTVYFSDELTLITSDNSVSILQMLTTRSAGTEDVVLAEVQLTLVLGSMTVELPLLNNPANKFGKLTMMVSARTPSIVVSPVNLFCPSKSKNTLQIICFPTVTGIHRSK